MFDLTLSFDNGPEPEVTPAVLDVLARRRLRATFFVIGQKLARSECRALAERAHAEGHWIGNHSYTHSLPLGLRSEPDVAECEIGRTQEALGPLAHARKFFRPFGGGGNLDRRLLNAGVVDFLTRGRYTCVLWDAIPRDWDDPDGWVERALAQCRAQAQCPAFEVRAQSRRPSTRTSKATGHGQVYDSSAACRSEVPDELAADVAGTSNRRHWTLMVLHDLPTGAMRHLDRFLDAVGEAGGRIRQDFPPACMPIVEGIPVLPLDDYIAAQPADNIRVG